MTTLYMAQSADGYIATHADETPWSDAEWAAFQAFVKTCDVILLGRRTYEIMQAQGEFVPGPRYMVATSDPQTDTGEFPKVHITTRADLPAAHKLGVIGGGDLNGRLAQLGVLDEIILDIEPILLGDGKRLFGGHEPNLTLELIQTRTLASGTVQNRYSVRR